VEEAGVHARTALEDPAAPEAGPARRAALDALLAAQEIYEKWLEEHPEDEDRLSRTLADLQRKIYWTRKNMPASEFPAAEPEPGEEPAEEDPTASPESADPQPASPPPALPHGGNGKTPPAGSIDPEREVERYRLLVRRCLRQGTPEEAVEAGRRLVADERMGGRREEIRPILRDAEDMVAFLDAARGALGAKTGADVELELREGALSGRITEVAGDVRLETAGGVRVLGMRELSGPQLVRLAELAGFFEAGRERYAAGLYLAGRGEREAAAVELVRARFLGADVSRFEDLLRQAEKRDPDLRALAAWLELEQLIEVGGPIVAEKVDEFEAAFHGTDLFRKHRLRMFEAAAEGAREREEFEFGEFYSVPAEISGKTKIHLTYAFDSPAELDDFEGRERSWAVSDGRLVGKRGAVWLERFDLRAANLGFVLPAAEAGIVGFWGRDRSGRAGVQLRMEPKDGELELELRHGDRRFARESVRVPDGPLEFTIRKRGDKYQVALNRRIVMKGSDSTGRQDEPLSVIGLACRKTPFAIDALEIEAALDEEWAEAGGNRFARWIRHWHVAGPFRIDAKDLVAGLARPFWPEEREFGPRKEDSGWTYALAPRAIVDLNRLKPNDGVAAYLGTRVWSPDRRTVVLEVVADDLARAWVNGELVLEEAPLMTPTRVAVRLEPGDNFLLVKVVEAKWGFWGAARILTKRGRPTRDLFAW